MDSKQRATERVFEDFDPTIEWERGSGADTLKLFLPGFKKEKLKVQVTSSRMLRIKGEKEVDENKWRRFRQEIPIPSYNDTNKITAKFEKGVLFITHPKIVIPHPQPPVSEKPPKPKPPAAAAAFKPQPPTPPLPANSSLKPQKSLPRKEREQPLKPDIESLKPGKPIKEEQPLKPEIESTKPGKPIKEEQPLKPEIESTKPGKPIKEEQPTSTDTVLSQNEQTEKIHADIRPQNVDNSDKDEVATSGTIATTNGNYRQVLSGMVKELKNPRKLLNSVMSLLLLLLLRLYAMITRAIRFFRKSET